MADEEKQEGAEEQAQAGGEAAAEGEAGVSVETAETPAVEGSEESGTPAGLGLEHLFDIQLEITVELGKTSLPIEKIVKLGPGSVITLNRGATEPVDICVNGKIVATGEVVTIGDSYGIRVTTVQDPSETIKALG